MHTFDDTTVHVLACIDRTTPDRLNDHRNQYRMKRSFSSCVTFRVVLALCLTLSSPLVAQSANQWQTGQQGATWLNTFVDHALTNRTAFWFDGHWRRTGLVSSPQQVILRPGVQFTLAPGVRVAAGYAYIATAPYGEFPSANPLREQRTWQQLLLTHAAGPATVIHRYRWEQRWISSLVGSGDKRTRGPSSYQHRARYQVRAQMPLKTITLNDRPALAFVYDELLLPVGHGDAIGRFSQNRIGGGIGIPLAAGQRMELGYMNLWNALPSQRANEINHTLVLSYVWVAQ